MKRQICALVASVCAALAAALPASAFAPQSAAAAQAISWLHGQQAADGTVSGSASRTEDTVIGLVANGQSITDFATAGKTPIDSLRSHISSEEGTAGNIGGLIMAVTAADLDPTAFAGHNLLQDLACTYNASTGAYNSQLFNDALAVLALPLGAASPKAVAFLADRQQADGGWEFSPPYGSDTNTTGIVVLALASAGGMSAIAKERVLAYFKTQQQPSGGFQYATGSGDSDPNSDAAVIQALLALGEDPTGDAWTVAGKNAVTDLLTFQFSNGGFGFFRPNSSSSAAPDALSTSQALAALASKYLPVARTQGTMPSTCATVATTPAPTLSPTPAARQLAVTGGQLVAAPPLLPPLAGGAMLVLGWRLRRRAG
jgi:prenyltransferase beta subunit